MKRILIAAILCLHCHLVLAADTDGDGLLDLIDAPGFSPKLEGNGFFYDYAIQDLDGAKLLVKVTNLNLFHNRVASVETGDFTGLTKLKDLDLGLNRISSVEAGDYAGLTGLEGLYLSDNRISAIANGGFQELANLQRLYLFGNRLNDLKGVEFKGLGKLQELLLQRNQITAVQSGDFQGLVALQRLNLSKNGLKTIDSGAFQGLDKLTWLGLFDNQLTSIESGDFQGLGTLRELHLSDNQISSIEKGDFQGAGALEEIYLRRNGLDTVGNGAFEGLANLRRIDLTDNGLTGWDTGAFRGLKKLDHLALYDNELTELNFADADFAVLNACVFRNGFCIDQDKVDSLILDDARLSRSSFAVIVGETTALRNVSLAGLHFSDGNPANLNSLLSIPSLDNVTLDASLFALYSGELNAFDALPGNTVTVVAQLGDMNGDGAVDLADLNFVRNHFGDAGGPVTASTHSQGDAIDLDDLNLVRNQFGAGTATTAVPEPGAAGLAALGVLLSTLLVRRRRTRQWR